MLAISLSVSFLSFGVFYLHLPGCSVPAGEPSGLGGRDIKKHLRYTRKTGNSLRYKKLNFKLIRLYRGEFFVL